MVPTPVNGLGATPPSAREGGVRYVEAPVALPSSRQVPDGARRDADPGPARGAPPQGTLQTAMGAQPGEELECHFLIATYDTGRATPSPLQCQATGVGPWIKACIYCGHTFCQDHAHTEQECPGRGDARGTPPGDASEGGSPTSSGACRGSSADVASSGGDGQPADTAAVPAGEQGAQAPSATPLEEADGAQGAVGMPPGGELAEIPAAILTDLGISVGVKRRGCGAPPGCLGRQAPGSGRK